MELPLETLMHNLGTTIGLLSPYNCGPHHMVQQYIHYNDLQSSWLEMKVVLSPGENVKNCPYLISKVFQIKLKELL